MRDQYDTRRPRFFPSTRLLAKDILGSPEIQHLESMTHRAIAVDGPLAGDMNLTVERRDDGDWPSEPEWTMAGGRVLYLFTGKVSIGSDGGRPMYEQALAAE
jgi:hypothetical protein